MANIEPQMSVESVIVAANENSIDSLLSSAFSMASNISLLSQSYEENDCDDASSSVYYTESHASTSSQNTHIQKHSSNRVNDMKCEKREIDVGSFACGRNVASDAHGVTTQNTPQFNVPMSASALTINDIEEIENDLEFYEKVSLVFLLYDSDDLALQRLRMAYKSHTSGSIIHSRLLLDWALHESSHNWQDKFLEALSIIKNNMWIKKLGFSIDDINVRFLPHNPDASLFVDPMRKALYIICESLTYQQLEHLQMLVERDMVNVGRVPDRYNAEFMEMNVLHWMSQRYLNIGVLGSCDVNIENLTKHLKVMEKLNLVSCIESIARSCYKPAEAFLDPSQSDRMSLRSSLSQGAVSSHSVVSQCHEESAAGLAPNSYGIDEKNVGFCVIINQKTFYKETDPNLQHLVYEDYLEPRIGTDVDRDRLCEVFMSFGFYVKIWENLTHTELAHAVHESATRLVKKEHSCFVLCVLSHGRKNAVYGVNSIAVEMDEIEKYIHGKFCPNLLQKPKIIIVQACQGLVKQNACSSDTAMDGAAVSTSCPEVSDTLTFWSTVPGYAAFRDRISGSWFIRALWDEMLQKGNLDTDVVSMFVNVNRKVCNRRVLIDGMLKTMTPQFTTCFRQKLHFPFHPDARKAAAKRMFERYLFDALLDDFTERIVRNRMG